MREFYEENEGAVKTAIIMIVLTIVVLVINSIVSNIGNVTTPKKLLDKLAKTYYEDELYPNIIERYPNEYKNVLAKYEQTGIKMTVKNFISIYTELDFSIFKEEKYASCDLDLTYVVIYPQSPYNVDSYTLKKEIYCDVENVIEEETDNTATDNDKTTASESEVE